MKKNNLKIVTFGGGGGHAQLLQALMHLRSKGYHISLSSFCTASDSGGSTGAICESYSVVSGWIGDVTKCLASISSNNGHMSIDELMYRFDDGIFQGHSLKNMLLTALVAIHGPERALDRLHEICGIDHSLRVEPVSFKQTCLEVKLRNQRVFSGETYIDTISRSPLWDPSVHAIEDVWLTPAIQARENVLVAVEQADFVITAPGDLFTSVIPALLPDGVQQSMMKTNAKLIFVLNLMTKTGETDQYTVGDFVSQLKRYTGQREPDYIICNDPQSVPRDHINRYYEKEHKGAIVLGNDSLDDALQKRLVVADLWQIDSLQRLMHDPKKIASVVADFLDQRD